MTRQRWTETDIEPLLKLLSSKDGMIRQKARRSLVAKGYLAVPSLNRLLGNPKVGKQVHWEAAKALGAIGDPKAIPSLVQALEDKDADVAWLAAEALERFKKAAWPALFHVLLKRGSKSVLLRQGAHHVLLNQQEEGFNHLLVALRKALQDSSVPVAVLVATHNILEEMKVQSECDTKTAAVMDT